MKKYFIVYCLLSATIASAQTWGPLGFGVSDDVHTLYNDVPNQQLLVGGKFLRAGKHYTSKFSRWDGSVWDNVDFKVLSASQVNSIISHDGTLYVAGNFNVIGGAPVNNIVSWNGTNWEGVGKGFNETVNCLYVFNDTLYAGGKFGLSGSDTTGHIAKWDGSSWLPVGDGINGGAGTSVNCIGAFKGKIYAGGKFLNAGGVPVENISYYDTRWNEVGGGISGTIAHVNAMEEYNGKLYVTGSFQTAGGNTVKNIASWDELSWNAVGGGLIGALGSAEGKALFSNGNKLFVGGNIASAGTAGNTVNNIAVWNDTIWSAVGNGVDGSVYAISIFNNELYVGGSFSNAGLSTLPTLNIAKWCPQNSSISGNVTYSGGNVPSGKATLFAINNSDVKMLKVDTASVFNGQYIFNNVPSGKFIIRVEADTTGMTKRTVTTYSGDKFKWFNADKITVSCGTVLTGQNIQLLELPTLNGKGKAKGKIKEGFKFEKTYGDPVPGIDVAIEQIPGGAIQQMTITEDNSGDEGSFSIDGLENGTYEISVEVPGIPMVSTYTFTITDTDTNHIDLNFSVDSTRIYREGTTSIISFNTQKEENKWAYPNPFDQSITFDLKGLGLYNIMLFDALGRNNYSKENVKAGLIKIETADLPEGIYFFRIDNREAIIASGTLIKK